MSLFITVPVRAAPPRAVSVAIKVVAIRTAPPTTVVTWPVISVLDILGARRCGCAKHAQRRQGKKKLLHDHSPAVSLDFKHTAGAACSERSERIINAFHSHSIF